VKSFREMESSMVLYEIVNFVLISFACWFAGDGFGKAEVYHKNWHDFVVTLTY